MQINGIPKNEYNHERQQALIVYNDLIKKLNKSILKESQSAKPNGSWKGYEVDIKGHILIDAEEIRKDLNTLRSLLHVIAATHQPGDDTFKDVYSELYPKHMGRELEKLDPTDNQ